MPGDNVDRSINFALLKELNEAPDDVKHFMGTQRCERCGHEHQALQPAAIWAMHPHSGECPKCEALACLFVHPDAPTDGEPYDYMVILPEDR